MPLPAATAQHAECRVPCKLARPRALILGSNAASWGAKPGHCSTLTIAGTRFAEIPFAAVYQAANSDLTAHDADNQGAPAMMSFTSCFIKLSFALLRCCGARADDMLLLTTAADSSKMPGQRGVSLVRALSFKRRETRARANCFLSSVIMTSTLSSGNKPGTHLSVMTGYA